MFKSIASAAVITATLSTTAMASGPFGFETTTWEGVVTGMSPACSFTENTPGVMEFDGVNKFNTTTQAEVKVRQRGATYIEAQAAMLIQGDGNAKHNEYVVRVKYNVGQGSEVLESVGPGEAWVAATDVTYTAGKDWQNGAAKIRVDNLSKGTHFKLGGTAKLSYSDHLIDNGNYTLVHTVTCVQ